MKHERADQRVVIARDLGGFLSKLTGIVMLRRGCWRNSWAVAAGVLLATSVYAPIAGAENHPRATVKSPLDSLTIFRKGFANDFFSGKVEQLENEEAAQKAKAVADTEKQMASAAQPAALQPVDIQVEQPKAPTTLPVVGAFKPSDLLPPDQVPAIRLNEDAPSPIFGMVQNMRSGDRETALAYAGSWVQYQQNFFFELREMTQLIGEAMVKQKVISEDDWDGVPQYLDYEFAKTRKETGALFKPTHEVAMKRVKPDSRNQAEVYYFFNFDCSYCRLMAPDVERIFRTFKFDRNVKLVGLTMGPTPKEWMNEYRKYTGLTMPVLEGEKMAKTFGVKFAPALVVVAPNNRHAYLKTGKQSFANMYDFIRTVQGLPSTVTPEIERIAATPVGEIETAKFNPGKNLQQWLGDDEREEVERPRQARAMLSGKQSSERTPKKASVSKDVRPKQKVEMGKF